MNSWATKHILSKISPKHMQSHVLSHSKVFIYIVFVLCNINTYIFPFSAFFQEEGYQIMQAWSQEKILQITQSPTALCFHAWYHISACTTAKGWCTGKAQGHWELPQDQRACPVLQGRCRAGTSLGQWQQLPQPSHTAGQSRTHVNDPDIQNAGHGKPANPQAWVWARSSLWEEPREELKETPEGLGCWQAQWTGRATLITRTMS